MEKITKGIYTYHYSAPQEEIELMNAVVQVNLAEAINSEIEDAITRVLKCDLTEQIHIIHCVLDTLYTLSEEERNRKIEKFLSDKRFEIHREVIMSVVNGDTEDVKWRERLESELGIKIVEFDDLTKV